MFSRHFKYASRFTCYIPKSHCEAVRLHQQHHKTINFCIFFLKQGCGLWKLNLPTPITVKEAGRQKETCIIQFTDNRKTEGELSGLWLYYVLWKKTCCTTIFKKRLKSVSNTRCMAYSSIITAVLPGIRVISRDRKAVHLLCHTVVWVSHESPEKFQCRQNSLTEKLLFHSTSPAPSVTTKQTTKYTVTIILEAVIKDLFRDEFRVNRRNSPA